MIATGKGCIMEKTLTQEQIQKAQELCAKAQDKNSRTMDAADAHNQCANLLPAALDSIEQLQAQAAAMREALTFVYDGDYEGIREKLESLGITTDEDGKWIDDDTAIWELEEVLCKHLLENDAGSAMLERLRVAEAMVDVLAEESQYHVCPHSDHCEYKGRMDKEVIKPHCIECWKNYALEKAREQK